jgi:tRNA-dihydrouridine synthase B
LFAASKARLLSHCGPFFKLLVTNCMNQLFWQEKFRIGSLEIPRFMAAPLDGITDSPLRQLIREFSPDVLLMTEMRHVSCAANEKDNRTVTYNQIEHPLAYQFSANRLDFLDAAVEKIIQHGFVMINLNSGCPAPIVTRSGSGSALMANLPQLELLIKAFVKAINGRIPFTLKIRAGYKHKNAVEVAVMAEANGVECIMIHPRTQPEGFTSRLDYELARQVKEAVKVPVVFSGNINKFENAKKVHELTGVDSFMIGRALWGAPWKIREITDAAQGIPFSIDTATALHYALKHLELNLHCFGPRGFIPFKKQLPQYIRSIQDAADWRCKLLRSQTQDEMRALMSVIIEQNGTQACAPL